MSAQINWNLLRTTALAVANNAYAPYSKFRVGAAALVDDGRIITGCNVENASYGLTLCAECGIISELARSGGGRLIALCTVGNDQPVTPCGRCRQLLWEHGGANMLLEVNGSPRKLIDMLPVSFPEESNFVNPESES